MSEALNLDCFKLVNYIQRNVEPDLTIKCGGKEFKVHSQVICAISDFFDCACHGGFREAETKVVDLEEDDLDAVDAMIDYMYNGMYLDETNPKISGRRTLAVLLNAKVYALADKYNIEGLSRQASEKLCLAIPRVSDPIGDDDFLQACVLAYKATRARNHPMRLALVKTISPHAQGIVTGGIRTTLEKCPELSMDLNEALAKQIVDLNRPWQAASSSVAMW